jgi:hypothetical protein
LESHSTCQEHSIIRLSSALGLSESDRNAMKRQLT